ncbi:pseudouridine synthase, RluA family [Rippkaea orientalis PCC 8801]|uniref:Pseudouridine synthase n=1 Tax=Rippkaea orientalis (strain PCC 8801 / RF-1) TaxID=41431 RepID=B7JYG3_RIPO1|nr:RluA family pseudouridine synthase [Rippkaea orientalis]ACK64833.1 pseudouridine synthase, RluA family [Rippkaea orientalis PCC 8801]
MNSCLNPSNQIELTVQDKGDRIDLWLSQNLDQISRSHLQKLIEQGNIYLNNQVCLNKKTKVNLGDRLQVFLPPPEPLELQPEPIPLDILYEDDSLIIINKSAGLVVHPAPGHTSGTLVHGLLYHCPNLVGIGGVQRPGIVHRLDKDTTGAIVVAKTDYAHQHLQAQLKAKTARREYLGVVYGVPRHKDTHQGTINVPIGRHRGDRKKMAVVPVENGGREAITHWQIVERLGNYTLVEFRLETGRTHQIRVHSSYIGHPIVGDPLYSSGGSVGVNLSGQALHAYRLILEHPVTGNTIEAIAPLPAEFTKLLTLLRQKLS